MPESRKDVHAWVQARVNEAGSIEKAKPADFTQKTWRELCQYLGVKSAKFRKVSTLEEALKAVAELARP